MTEWIMCNIAGAIISFLVGALLTALFTNRKHIIRSVKAWIYKKEDFRVSIAYLFRIKIDNRYLLIRGKRIQQYQPVGGVYKYYSSFEQMFNSLGLRNEDNETFYEKNDLRVYVKGSHLDQLIKWFESRKNRECTVEREFIEELIDTGILEESILKNVKYEYLSTVNNGIHYSKHFKCKEVLIFDIFDVLLDDETKAAIKLAEKQDKGIILATYEDLERECIEVNGKSYKIGAHSKYVR